MTIVSAHRSLRVVFPGLPTLLTLPSQPHSVFSAHVIPGHAVRPSTTFRRSLFCQHALGYVRSLPSDPVRRRKYSTLYIPPSMARTGVPVLIEPLRPCGSALRVRDIYPQFRQENTEVYVPGICSSSAAHRARRIACMHRPGVRTPTTQHAGQCPPRCTRPGVTATRAETVRVNSTRFESPSRRLLGAGSVGDGGAFRGEDCF